MRFYLDTNAFIEAVETPGRTAEAFGMVLQRAGRSNLPIASVTSELTLAELLVKPIRDRDEALVAAYNNLLAGGGEAVATIPISLDILRDAARILAHHKGLKLPDAIHVATAERASCTQILSSDKRLQSGTRLPVWDTHGADLAAFIEMMS
ncbi:PIN domain-containing protein [Ancylobacter tetraedralis]